METELEKLIDKYNLELVLGAIATVCEEKADHLRANWQDHSSAGHWEDAAAAVSKLAASSAARNVSG